MNHRTADQFDLPGLSGCPVPKGNRTEPDRANGQNRTNPGAQPDKTGQQNGQADFSVRCTDCRHFQPDAINPADGLGTCLAASTERMAWPLLATRCSRFEISRPALERIAREISRDPETFAAGVWADGAYTHPQQIRRLAQLVNESSITSDWRKTA